MLRYRQSKITNSIAPCPMPHTSLREAAPTATLSTSAPCPIPNP
ncbi:hypothetical protein [Nostoc sp.]